MEESRDTLGDPVSLQRLAKDDDNNYYDDDDDSDQDEETDETIPPNISRKLRQLRQDIKYIKAQTFGHSLSTQSSTLEIVTPDNKEIVGKSSDYTPVVAVLARIFFAGVAMLVPVLVSMIILINTNQTQAAFSTGFAVFVMLGGSWGVFGTVFGICYAPTNKLVFWVGLLYWLSNVLCAYWTYYYFQNVVAVIVVGAAACACMVVVIIFRKLFVWVSALPFEELTLQAWLTAFRLYIVAAAPVVSKTISSGELSVVGLYAIWSFATACSFLCFVLRIGFAVRPTSKSTAGMIQKFSAEQIFLLLGPSTAMMIVFAPLYLIAISGSDSSAPQAVIIILLALFAFFVMFNMLVIFAAFTRLKILAYVNPLREKDYVLLDSARVRGQVARQKANIEVSIAV